MEKVRDALLAIIDAANANSHPIHYKVRDAIIAARAVLDAEAEAAVAAEIADDPIWGTRRSTPGLRVRISAKKIPR